MIAGDEAIAAQLTKNPYQKTIPMKIRFLTVPALLFSLLATAQDFPYGAVSLKDLQPTTYAPDTSAGAVVLKEFGQALISNGDNYNLIFRYHARIKILNENGLSQSDIEVFLRKQDGNTYKKMTDVKASSFNIQEGRIVETPLDRKDVFTEDRNKFYNVKRFAIPNVREGTVIEVSYAIESPFIFNFRSWEFQSDILEDIAKPITRKLEIEVRAFDEEAVENFLLNPFFFDKWNGNPFKSKERLYPVDFGAPLERISVLSLEYPPAFELVDVPEKMGLLLPDGGGRFLFDVRNVGNKLSLSNSLSIRKTVFSSTEYHYLKELFSRILQVQNSELVFKRKT